VLKARRYVDSVLVVDDGSTDDTAWLAEACGALVIRQRSNQGKAAALNAGLARARELDAQAAILIDGDGQQNPADIPTVLGPVQRGEADIVIGSRFLGAESKTPSWRVAGQKLLNWATNMASGVPLTDTQSGFRALSRKAIGALNFRTTGFSAESEMQFIVRTHQLVVREVPIVVNYDEGPKRNPVRHGFQVLNGILRMIGQHRPLLYFGAPGLIVLIVGLALGIGVVGTYRAYSALAVGTALIAITLVLLGVFAIFTGLILHTIRAYMTER
ncbi:MAG: glycosyltransferase family 2 protein, partial [Anaerolineae bacterium]|nr:glycosyltransferase family 2 protein [Anaerolineae bacterium]